MSYFLAILLISAVITILGYFGSLLPARTVTVKTKKSQKSMKIDELKTSKNDSIPRWISQLILNRKHRNQFKCNYALSFV